MYSGDGVRGVGGPYDTIECLPSIDDESLSLNMSLMNFALYVKLSKLSASDTSLSSSAIGLIIMFCFLACHPCAGLFRESS
jgi:hypothetical protein